MTPSLPDNPQSELTSTSASVQAPTAVVSASRLPPERTPDEQLLERALLHFRLVSSTESPWRKKAQDELAFCDDLEHWTTEMREERKGRPCLTFDRISPSVDQVINDMRQNPPEPKVAPVGSGSDKDTAEIIQGILRNIDQDSSASIAYLGGYEYGVKIGRGWWRILTEFEEGDTFDQKIMVKRIPNPFSVYPDPSAIEFDYSDMRFCFVTEDLDKDLFEETYGEKSIISAMSTFEGVGDRVKTDWFPNGSIRVAEYWWVEESERTIAMLSDGRVVSLEDMREGENAVTTRKKTERKIYWAKMTGVEILERGEWSGKYIPIVPVIGKEYVGRDGKKKLKGMIRPAMDANLSYDYMRSKQVEAVGLAPIAPWLVVEGQLENYEQDWQKSNRTAFPFLTYRLVTVDGKPAPAPHRDNQEPAIQAITIAVQHADNDIKATLSTYDASLGAPGPEQSGRAILARQREGDNVHFNYHDNLARSMRHTGRIIVDLIPHVYTDERIMTIFDPDGSSRQVTINAPTKWKNGEERIFKIGKKFGLARYDVTVGTGPSYASRREQANAMLMQLIQALPGPMSRTLDLLVKSFDIPDGDKIAERVRPPDIQQEQDGEVQIPPQAQQAMNQQGQMIDVLSKRLDELTEIVKTKKLELDSAERIASQSNLTRLAVAEVTSKSTEARELAKMDHAAVAHTIDVQVARENAEAEAERGAQEAQAKPEPTE